MRKFLLGVSAIIFLMILSACATSALTSVWEDSAYKGGPAKKILIIGVFKDQDEKTSFEDEFQRQLKAAGTDAVVSHTVFPEEDIIDREAIKSKVKELNVDSVLVTRVMDVKNAGGFETYPSRVDAGGGGSFYDYYVMCCQTMVSEGYVLVLETKIFEGKSDKPIWSALSETSLQYSRESTFRVFIESAIKNLRTKHLI